MGRVGTDIGVWKVGVPVSRRFRRALEQAIIRKTLDGTWFDAEAKYRPPDICGALGARKADDESDMSLRAKDMAGPFLLTGAMVLATFLRRARCHRKKLQDADGDSDSGREATRQPETAPDP